MSITAEMQGNTVRRRVLRRPAAPLIVVLAWLWLGLVVFGAVFASVLAPQGSDAQNVLAMLQGPGAGHVLGTDSLGRSVLVRLMYGARPTLEGAGIVVVITLGIGATAGLAAGYLGGLWDRILSTISDVAQSIPGLLIGLVVFAVFPDNVHVVMAVSGLFMCAPMFRVVRAAALTVRGELYVAAARAAGLSHTAILRRHVARRVAGVIRVQVSMMAALGIAIEISLGFLGLDVAPPAPSWGSVLDDGAHYMTTDLWLVVPPVVVIALTIVSLGILGEEAQARISGRGRRRRRLGLSRWRAPRRAPQHGDPLLASVTPAGAVAPVEPARNGFRAESTSLAGDPATSSEDSTILRVRDLTVATAGGRELALVDHVSFDVRRGEVLGLVGETGAGKSVIARALLGVGGNRVVSGTINFDGFDLATADARGLARIRGRRIGYVGQDPMSALDPLVRIENQLIEAVRTHRKLSRSSARTEARRLLGAVRIPEPDVVARKYPFEISGGQAQRVAIALALAGDPELLIADEPTTALDVTVQMAVLGLLKELQGDRGLTIILVTHDWGVVADMCDRVLTLYAGEIVESGEVHDVFRRPSHPYTAALRQADPHLQTAGEQLTYIPGAVPPPGERPAGCRFADRCPLVIDDCRAVHPALLDVGSEIGEKVWAAEADDSGPDGQASRCIRVSALREGAAHV